MKGVVKSLKTRNRFLNLVITLAAELKSIYLDDEENVVFHEYYLGEIQATPVPSTQSASPNLLQQSKPIHSIAKNMVLDKYNGEKKNAKVWLDLFTSECKQMDIEDEKYAEVLRLFLEGSASEWYMNFLKINSLTYPWEFWYNSFIDTFAQILWAEIEYAYAFKYLNGSYLNFALKKKEFVDKLDLD